MGIGALVLVLLVGLLLVGLWLVIAGIRGERVEPHTACRACEFDLTGLEAAVCPECGAALSGPESVRVVQRRRNTRRVLTGAVLVAASLAVPASVLVDSAMSGRLSALLPTWILAIEMRALGASTPKSVCDELVARSVKGEVTDSTLRTVATAIVNMRVGDESLPPSLNMLVGDAAAKGLISKDLLAAHVISPRLLAAQVPERVWPEDPLVERLINYSASESRIPASGAWVISRRVTRIDLDGERQPTRAPKSSKEASDWIATCIYAPAMVTHVPPPAQTWQLAAVPIVGTTAIGKHTVRVHFVVEAYLGRTDTAPGRAEGFRDYTVEVMAPDKPLVTLVDDVALKKQIASQLQVVVMGSKGGISSGVSVTVRGGSAMPKPAAPTVGRGVRVGGAWNVYLEAEGERVPLGKYKVGWRSDSDVFQATWGLAPKLPPGASHCRVIFVPNERYAAARDALDLMPEGEIVIEDVPIQ